MLASMAGATITGARVASTVAEIGIVCHAVRDFSDGVGSRGRDSYDYVRPFGQRNVIDTQLRLRLEHTGHDWVMGYRRECQRRDELARCRRS